MPSKTLFLTLMLVISCVCPSFSQTYDEWVNRSFDYLEEDSIAQAADCLKRAMRLEPGNARNGLLFNNLGTLQRRLGQLNEAEVSYSCAIAMLPDMDNVRQNRAELYSEMERYQDAIEDYTFLLNQHPQHEDWLYQRALCRLLATDTIGAREDLEAIDKFKPLSAKSRIGMAVVYKARGEYSMAEELYNALIEANPNSWSLLRDRAEVYLLSKRYGAALTDINEAIQRNPQDPMCYILRAEIRFAKGDKEYARRDINIALEKGISKQVVSNLVEKYR